MGGIIGRADGPTSLYVGSPTDPLAMAAILALGIVAVVFVIRAILRRKRLREQKDETKGPKST